MAAFTFEKTRIQGLYIVHPFYMEDERGYFLKHYEKNVFLSQGIQTDIFECYESSSIRGVIRGLHFQRERPQAKLVQVLTGRIFDVAVDLRPESETFGQWEGFDLDAQDHMSLLIPEGFAHGFAVVSDSARVSYICSNAYIKEFDAGIRWDDPDIGIRWPECGPAILSARDRGLPSFHEYRTSVLKGE